MVPAQQAHTIAEPCKSKPSGPPVRSQRPPNLGMRQRAADKSLVYSYATPRPTSTVTRNWLKWLPGPPRPRLTPAAVHVRPARADAWAPVRQSRPHDSSARLPTHYGTVLDGSPAQTGGRFPKASAREAKRDTIKPSRGGRSMPPGISRLKKPAGAASRPVLSLSRLI